VTSTLYVQNKSGDTRIEWDPGVPAEVAAAKAAWDAARDKRYLAYRTRADGSKGEILRNWDPTAERIVMSPQLQGG